MFLGSGFWAQEPTVRPASGRHLQGMLGAAGAAALDAGGGRQEDGVRGASLSARHEHEVLCGGWI